MKGQKIYNLALLKLIGAYALFTGIIASVFLFFIVLPQQKISQQTPQATPSVSVNTTSTATPNPTEVFCTMEVKLCPDGTSVGRHGPNCAFDLCPKPR